MTDVYVGKNITSWLIYRKVTICDIMNYVKKYL